MTTPASLLRGPFIISFIKLTPCCREAFDITVGVIKKFKDSVEQHVEKFVLVTFSNPEQVHPLVQDRVEELDSVFFDFEQPEQLIESFAKQ